jgi:hypothetical protein
VSSGDRTARDTASGDDARNTESAAAPFLRTWQEAMGQWSSGNHDALKNVWTR